MAAGPLTDAAARGGGPASHSTLIGEIWGARACLFPCPGCQAGTSAGRQAGRPWWEQAEAAPRALSQCMSRGQAGRQAGNGHSRHGTGAGRASVRQQHPATLSYLHPPHLSLHTHTQCRGRPDVHTHTLTGLQSRSIDLPICPSLCQSQSLSACRPQQIDSECVCGRQAALPVAGRGRQQQPATHGPSRSHTPLHHWPETTADFVTTLICV